MTIPNPNFKFQVRDKYWPGLIDKEDEGWGEWADVEDDRNLKLIEVDGFLVLEGVGGADEYMHQVRIVFLPEDGES